MAKIKQDIEKRLVTSVIDNEYVTGQKNNRSQDSDYLDFLDMFNCERTLKNYDWMSDIFFPEFYSQMMTQLSADAAIFKTHDFVETYIGSTDEIAQRSAKATKKVINTTLNRRELYFFHKIMRAFAIKNLVGVVYFRAWWEQEMRSEVVGMKKKVRNLNVDVEGNPITDPETQVPAQEFYNEPVEADIAIKDHFNFDIMDSRDVFVDSSYVYNIQDKRWVIIRFEKTVDELKDEAEDMEYFNLDKLTDDNDVSQKESKSGVTTHYDMTESTDSIESPYRTWTILQRFGKHLVVVKETDQYGNPVSVRPGIDASGKRLPNAEMREMVITFAIRSGKRHLIGYNPARTIDAYGKPYRPLGRMLCYIHPSKDDGMGDGKASREMQVAINDTLNMEADRTKLSTIPIVQGSEFDITDNDSLEWRPGAFWKTETGQFLQEIKISGDVTGALNEVALYRNISQQATGISQETQSMLAPASTSATASANQAARSDRRSDFRALTAEFTGMSDLWWMINQMTAQFMRIETAQSILGNDFIFFNPSLDYTYKPLASVIENDSAKQSKITNWIQILSFVANNQNPNTPAAVNFILSRLAELMGSEYETFAGKFLLDENSPPPQSGGGNQSPQVGAYATNQTGLPQNQIESQVRGVI